jgi:BNR/Asp-box repeat
VVDSAADPPFVGALEVDPADGTLLLATNRGLYRVRKGRIESVRSRMGSSDVARGLAFRFTGPGEAVGSGHPGRERSEWAVLGLVRTKDAGRTWRSVSRLGAADYHAIAVSGGTLAAALGGEATVHVSRDGGRTFQQPRTAPLALQDLELDPADPRRWVGTAETGVHLTTDGGQTWRPADPAGGARIAWPASDALFRTDLDGRVSRSSDGGLTWEDVGRVDGETHALAAVDERTLYAADVEGVVRVSRDGGETWTEFARP